ncbi:MAG: helix-turn-helix domain-containing protein [Christensenellales bacterium]|jgi:YesN/AraC family two-component response regulator
MLIRIFSDNTGLIDQINALLSLHAPNFLPLKIHPPACFEQEFLQKHDDEVSILDLSSRDELPTFIFYQSKMLKKLIFYHESPNLKLTLQMMRWGFTRLLTSPIDPILLLCYLNINPTENSTRLIIQEVRAYVDQHFAEPISVGELAERFGINACRLSTVFKQYQAEGLNRYITLLRLERARDLLLTTDKSIPEIAALCGFSCSKYFASVFKNETSSSPDVFRKQHKAEGSRL